MPRRWVLFDLNGTLLDPSSIAQELGAGDDAGRLVDQAFDDALFHSMADTLSGEYRSIPEYLRAALERRLIIAGHGTGHLDAAMRKATAMDPFPEAPEALDRLREGGLELAVLTNSSTESAESSLEAAGLRQRLSAVIGSEAVRAFKPHPAVYRHGLETVGAQPREACMVAAHGWDLMGAKRVGMITAWVSRKEGLLLSTLPEPDVSGEDLLSVARSILEHP
jgi:2-haloacid dehalogenase